MFHVCGLFRLSLSQELRRAPTPPAQHPPPPAAPAPPQPQVNLTNSASFRQDYITGQLGEVWTTGRPVRQLDSLTTNTCFCKGFSMWLSVVLLKYAKPSLKIVWMGTHV